ncbi:hypothetical protein [Nitrosopumilus sp.]|uniref:hypothetical protein n=1 Tax=Nitrosopumilus sp. TaxID=2024843 RepID=UPI002931A977|nr:hypothetical protein [Nitrosopumilus sp.]
MTQKSKIGIILSLLIFTTGTLFISFDSDFDSEPIKISSIGVVLIFVSIVSLTISFQDIQWISKFTSGK